MIEKATFKRSEKVYSLVASLIRHSSRKRGDASSILVGEITNFIEIPMKFNKISTKSSKILTNSSEFQ